MLKIKNFFFVCFKIRSKKVLFFNIVLFLISFILSFINIGFPLLQKYILENISKSNIFYYSTLYLSLSLCYFIFLIIESAIIKSNYYKYKRTLEKKIMDSYFETDNKNVKRFGSGAFVSSMYGDAEMMAQALSINYYIIFSSIISSIVICAISIQWSIKFVLIAVISIIVVVLVVVVCDNYSSKKIKLGREKIYELNPFALEVVENRISILSNGLFDTFLNSLDKKTKERDGFFYKSNIAKSISSSFVLSIPLISFSLFFVISINDLLSGKITLELLIVFLSYYSLLFKPITLIKDAHENLVLFNAFFDRQKNIFDTKKTSLPYDNSIVLNDVSFSLTEKSILSNVTLKLDYPLGVVGLSGEGKTTLVKLICGLIEPLNGEILIGGERPSNINDSIIYSLINYLPQDVQLFDSSVLDNITLGKTGLPKSGYYKKLQQFRENCKKCINMSELSNSKNADYMFLCETFFISDKREQLTKSEHSIDLLVDLAFSKKYYIKERLDDLMVRLGLQAFGVRKIGQRGSNISGGEKSRIAIARFLLDETKQVFIMDEPLIGLDSINKNYLMQVLSQEITNKKGIIISHDLDIIRHLSKKIAVIDDTKLKVYDNHDIALLNSHIYCELWREYKES